MLHTESVAADQNKFTANSFNNNCSNLKLQETPLSLFLYTEKLNHQNNLSLYSIYNIYYRIYCVCAGGDGCDDRI